MDLDPDILPKLSGGAALVLLGKEVVATWWRSRQKTDDDAAKAVMHLEVSAARMDERLGTLEGEVKDLRRIKHELLNHHTTIIGHVEHLREHVVQGEKRHEAQVSQLFQLVRELRDDTNPRGGAPG